MGLARFKGKYNSVKGKVYWLLIQESRNDNWLRASEISNILGLNLSSLLVLLLKWSAPDWQRVKRRKKNGFWEYTIAYKGEKWFETWSWLMPLNKWRREIEEWQSRHNPKKENNEDNGTNK